MKRTYKLFLVVIMLLLIVCVGLLSSYAFFNKEDVNSNDVTYVESNEYLSINYLDGNSFDVKELKSGESVIKRVSISNVTDDATYVTISLMDVYKSNNQLKIVVTDENNNEVYNDYLDNMDIDLVKTKQIFGKDTLKYTIKITNEGEDDLTGFSCNLLIYKEIVAKEVSTFYDLLLKNNTINQAVTNIGEESILNEGLIQTTDDDGVAYYFRGSVDNNYVMIGSDTYRIVRINGDGSIRLVLNYTVGELSSYKNTINTEDYFSNVLFSSSDLYNTLNTWYSDNLGEYKDYVVESKFCSDNSFTSEDGNTKYFGSYSRVMTDYNTSLQCMGTVESNYVGLLSIDDVIYAGASNSKNNTSYYLYNDGITSPWWTSSASQVVISSNVVDMFTINNQGGINYQNKVSMTLGVRPVISISKNTVVSGSGTLNDPYKISTN